ncbi:hypothetical protein BY996DRAFT_6423659 [Phakopsora pachyrhizi]|uniref:Expressed protein n=1 Tax=Phakopsora pachyrhizi TaxID=170000 RepID=A0AAV0AKX0_PHAPC|nr:hypothetical protein BY996DRAFT_6423659 [Phakopsora pachyrhizi]CAH7667592.1 expressed protein [Phakopsora pachyrhizi]
MFGLKTIIVAIAAILQVAEAIDDSGCASKCMAVKLTEAAVWFGQGNLSTYCQHPEFITAYDSCLGDNCTSRDELEVAKRNGRAACAAASINSVANNVSSIGRNNSPADMPAGAGNRSTGSPSPTVPTNTSVNINSTLLTPNSTVNATNSRFSNAPFPAISAAANSTASTITCSSMIIGLTSALVLASL